MTGASAKSMPIEVRGAELLLGEQLEDVGERLQQRRRGRRGWARSGPESARSACARRSARRGTSCSAIAKITIALSDLRSTILRSSRRARRRASDLELTRARLRRRSRNVDAAGARQLGPRGRSPTREPVARGSSAASPRARPAPSREGAVRAREPGVGRRARARRRRRRPRAPASGRRARRSPRARARRRRAPPRTGASRGHRPRCSTSRSRPSRSASSLSTCHSARTDPGARDRRAQALEAPVGVDDRALLLRVDLGREDDVGVLADRLGEERGVRDHGARGGSSARSHSARSGSSRSGSARSR